MMLDLDVGFLQSPQLLLEGVQKNVDVYVQVSSVSVCMCMFACMDVYERIHHVYMYRVLYVCMFMLILSILIAYTLHTLEA